MNDDDRFRLYFGPYRLPQVRIGQRVDCEVRGLLKIVGLSDAPIIWPIGIRDSNKSLVVFRSLAKAIRRESNQAVAHHWGVTAQTVSKWRRLLDIAPGTDGYQRLRQERAKEPWFKEVQKAGWESWSEERRANQSKRYRGRKVSAKEAKRLRAERQGIEHTVESRRKISETLKRLHIQPPGIGRPWTAEEDEAVRTLSPLEAAKATCRTQRAVKARRRKLGVQAAPSRPWTPDEDEVVRTLSPQEAAKATGRTYSAVTARRWTLGVRMAPRPWTPEEDKAILEMSFADAVAFTGRSWNVVTRRRKELGVARQSPTRK